MRKRILAAFVAATVSCFAARAAEPVPEPVEAEESFDQQSFIMAHIKDAHSFHIADFHGHAVSVPLPVILIGKTGVNVFMSSAFRHDNSARVVVERGGERYVLHNETVYYASPEADRDGSYLQYDATGNIVNDKPFDLSFTKNMVTLTLAMALLFAVFLTMGRFYRRKENVDKTPRGIARLFEPVVVYLRDEVIRPNVGEELYRRYTPYLLTLFFFILFVNLLGLIPFFPFGANVSGNTAFTLPLAFFTFVLVQINGTKEYWKEIVSMPGVPKPIMIVLAPVEFLGLFTKPFALTIRLFASILGGHITILSLLMLIFVFKLWPIVPASGLFVVFMTFIEILVAVIQAYIFTLLTSIYIGAARVSAEHE